MSLFLSPALPHFSYEKHLGTAWQAPNHLTENTHTELLYIIHTHYLSHRHRSIRILERAIHLKQIKPTNHNKRWLFVWNTGKAIKPQQCAITQTLEKECQQTNKYVIINGSHFKSEHYLDISLCVLHIGLCHGSPVSWWSLIMKALVPSQYLNESTPTWYTCLNLFIWSQYLYMFWALLAHLQEALHSCYLV
jgi:hypothetical protein